MIAAHTVRRLLAAPPAHVAAACLLLAVAAPISHAAGDGAASPPKPPNPGEAIYRYGILPSGRPLQATREAGMPIAGADAACANCHKRSGLGAKEGRISIPPITGRYLFYRAASEEALDLPYVESMRIDHVPYTAAKLARAIRDGIAADGRPLSYLMPRFALDDAEMEALVGYLKSLDRRSQPGVTGTELHFATIITPDADPVKREGMLSVLNQFFSDKNDFPLGATPRLRAFHKEKYMVNRRWQLHVWQLSGPASTWQSQLEKDFAKEPVFAVVSGLGGENWGPVHAFCEHQAVPCLFPNVEAPPPGADRDFYSLYYSRGVELEAGLIAKELLRPEDGQPADGSAARRVVRQVYREGDSGEAGARALARALEQAGVTVRNEIVAPGKPGRGIRRALGRGAGAEALVLWLRPPDIAALGEMPEGLRAVYMSGLMGGLEQAPLPPSWRGRTHLAYPFALQEERRVNVDYAFGWFAIKRIPVVAQQVQADTFLACSLLAEALHDMVGTFVPDYLVERMENMIDRRLITGYYPRLTLAPGQRFASKGGYIVHFPQPEGTQVAADSGWLVP